MDNHYTLDQIHHAFYDWLIRELVRSDEQFMPKVLSPIWLDKKWDEFKKHLTGRYDAPPTAAETAEGMRRALDGFGKRRNDEQK